MAKRFVSFVIPAKDEQKSIRILYEEIIGVMIVQKVPFEIIFIDDGSTDKTLSVMNEIKRKDKRVKTIELRGNWGKSVALQVGFESVKGDIIFTMDADLQDNPKEIPRFIKKLDEGYDLVGGWKKNRYDPISKVISSRVINFICSLLTGVRFKDINCGFKVYRRAVIESLNLYGDLYRFIPVFAAKENFRVVEIAVLHRKRKFGKSKYGWDRAIKGILDLLTVFFIVRYLRSPLHFFGTVGLIFFGFGFSIGLYITYLRLTTGGIAYRQPLLFLGMLLMIIGIQFISTGLLAEMMTRFNQKKDMYRRYIKI